MFGFLGAWLAFFYNDFWLRWKKTLAIMGIALLFIPQVIGALPAVNMNFNNFCSLTLTSIGTFFLLPSLSELRTGKGFFYRFLTFVSIVSYSMYLVNFSLVQLTIIPSLTGTIIMFTRNHLVISVIRYLLYWILTFGLSYIMYSFYEKPMMQLRERFRKRNEVPQAVVK